MALIDLTDWMNDHSGPGALWYAKRLSANDTLANNTHQAGPYFPKSVIFSLFPKLYAPEKLNPRVQFSVHIDSHSGDTRNVTAIWYNNKLHGGTRDDARLTNFGGAASALLNPDSTGSLAVFAFHKADTQTICHVWVCGYEIEADLFEERIGAIEPGKWKIWPDHGLHTDFFKKSTTDIKRGCFLTPSDMPTAWGEKFPSGAEIIRKTLDLCPGRGIRPDARLLHRRHCEFEIFQSVEQCLMLPQIQQGFHNIDDFVELAQTILQRRKARSGRSLELHVREIFIEEALLETHNFQYQPQSEAGKTPDFLFPNQAAYQNKSFPSEYLRMLAVKTTCKDRWRQIINEADRIPQKHLLTLQEGVSVNQFAEMQAAGVQLVVPSPLIKYYPETIRPNLLSLESFIADIRHNNLQVTQP